jgi:hypothetical protein
VEGIVFVALIMIVAWVVGNNRKHKSECQERSASTSEAIRLSIIENLVRAQYNALDEVVSLHIKALAKKYDMLTFTDDYGNENTARFKNEAEYFVKPLYRQTLSRKSATIMLLRQLSTWYNSKDTHFPPLKWHMNEICAERNLRRL